MSLIEDRKARMKALRTGPSAATRDSAASNVVQFTAKVAPAPVPSASSADQGGGGAEQLDAIIANTDPENQTAGQKDAAAATRRAEEFAAQFVSFRDNEDAFYILHEGEALSLTSTRCSDVFRAAARAINSKLTKDGIEQLQSMLRPAALAKPCKAVYRRIGKDGDAYLIDLGDRNRHHARVDAHGVTVVPSSGAVFSRGKGYGELPAPVVPTDAAQAWSFLVPLLLGFSQPDHLPLIAVMVEWLRSDTPHPILILIGQEGSGKSTAAERVVMAIDPFVGKLPSVAHSERGFYSAAQSRHAMTLDNLSAPLKRGLEDDLCRSSYGAAIMVPELYTTAENRTLTWFVAWIITGISNQIIQADTLDRAWVIRIEQPKSCRSPEALRAEFESAQGQVLGALLYFLGESIRRGPTIKATHNIMHRLYDFLVTGEAVSQATGHVAGSFLAAADRRRSTSAQDWIKYDLFAAALVKCVLELIRATKAPPASVGNWKKWHTQPGYSVFQINGRVFVAATAEAIHRMVVNATLGFLGKESACIPTSAPAAADALDRIQNQMTRAGWTVRRQPVNGDRNTIWVFGVPP